MENFEENLVGSRPEDQSEGKSDGSQTKEGQAIYMALLEDPDALVISKEEIEIAKNRLEVVKDKHPEVIQMCAHKSLEECRTIIRSLEQGNQAA